MWLPFKTPYPWIPRCWWRNIRGIYYDFYHGICNLFQWFKIVWEDRDWDHYYLTSLLEFKFRRMAELEEKYGHHTTSARDARNIRICQHLCGRLRDDEYIDRAKVAFGERTRATYKEALSVQRQDQALLGKIISRQLTNWWD